MRLKYKCPKCELKSYSKQWNIATRKKYGIYSDGEICEIQEEENNSSHLCPECHEESEWFKGELILLKSL